MPKIRLAAVSDQIGYGYPYYYGYSLYPEPFTDRDGIYTITGLVPGEYRARAYDPKGEFMPFLYNDIPIISEYYYYPGYIDLRSIENGPGILTKDLANLNITNPVIQAIFIYEDFFMLKVRIEKTDNSILELYLAPDYRVAEDWFEALEKDANGSVFLVDLEGNRGDYYEYYEKDFYSDWKFFILKYYQSQASLIRHVFWEHPKADFPLPYSQ